jgi:transcriptional regulator with XRE-family HTH domain
MIFADKLITLRKKAGWSQEELAEQLGVTRQSVSKWEGAQSVPDIDKILQMSRLFGVTTDYLLKDNQGEPEYTPDDEVSPLPRVTLAQANDYLAKTQANAPKLALATALCIVSPIPLLALGTLREAGLFGIRDDLAGGIGIIALLVIIAAAVAIFMQCSASVRAYEFLQEQAIETEYGVTGLAKERRDAFAPQYDKANIIGTVLCVLSAVPMFAAMMAGASFLVSASICLVLVLVACGVYAFVRVGTVQGAMDQLLEEGDYTRPNKAIKSRINALTAAYWLVVVAIFLWYTFGPYGNGQPQYSWFIWAIAGVLYAALVIAVKAFMKKNR